MRSVDVGSIPAGDPPHRPRRVRRAATASRCWSSRSPGTPASSSTRAKSSGAARATRCSRSGAACEVPARPLALILGADAFRGLPAWHRWKDISRLAHIVVVARPGDAVRTAAAGRAAAEWKRARTSTIPTLLRARPPAASTFPAGHARRSRRLGHPRGTGAASRRTVEIAGLLPRRPFWPILTRNDSTRATHRMRLDKLQKIAVAALEDIKARDITGPRRPQAHQPVRHADHRQRRFRTGRSRRSRTTSATS